ncbi:ankyrin repeat domain-containing protein 7-like [Scleropages formosus]|uniref:ankyrin repeat domain-containing protein 7-like n=1 Tax=Scleropages formosus TaxID=113540 RepID=UPI00087846AB|nr:ankyrin repeat domain-containing protein 7-like [Scleropages formosus]
MRRFVRFVMDQKASSESPETSKVSSSGYEVKEKDLGKVHRAACSGDLAKLKKLTEKNDLNQVDKENRTPLHFACAKGHAEINVTIVQFLVDSNVELDKYDSQKHSPLMKAVQCQQERCALTLLEHNADPNLVDIDGNTALHLAASIPSIAPLPLAKLLLEHKAHIDAQNSNGCTPLILAVMVKHFEMAKLLLEEGADVNTKDHEQWTPVMIAAYEGLANLVSLLLLHNADVTAKDKRGKTTDDHAVCNGYFLSVFYLFMMKAQNSKLIELMKASEKKIGITERPQAKPQLSSPEQHALEEDEGGDHPPDLKYTQYKNCGYNEALCVMGFYLSGWDSSSIESMDISGYIEVLCPEVDARNDIEHLLQQEPNKGECTQKCVAKAADHHVPVHNLSAQLSAAKTRVDSLESEFHRTMLSLTEKNLLLETVQRELHGTQAHLAELQAALQVKQEQSLQLRVHQKAMPHQITQTKRKMESKRTIDAEMQSQLLKEYEKIEKEVCRV